MKQRIQKYLSGEREGFSLIELIIVIAIMAILIGVVALAVIPYLEQSRESKDSQTVDTVNQAFSSTIAVQQIAIPTSDVTLTIKDGITASDSDVLDDEFIIAFAEALGAPTGKTQVSEVQQAVLDATINKLGSKKVDKDTGIVCKITADGEIRTDCGELFSSNRASSDTATE